MLETLFCATTSPIALPVALKSAAAADSAALETVAFSSAAPSARSTVTSPPAVIVEFEIVAATSDGSSPLSAPAISGVAEDRVDEVEEDVLRLPAERVERQRDATARSPLLRRGEQGGVDAGVVRGRDRRRRRRVTSLSEIVAVAEASTTFVTTGR